MMEAASTIDGCSDDDQKRQAFHSLLAGYRLAISKLIPDAVGKFLEIILASSHILNGDSPHDFLKSQVTKELIEPASRMTHAWLHWVLKGHFVGYNAIPLGIED